MEVKNGLRKLRMNNKGLSVIFGVLILIAIAVIAGIIIYLYTSGYLATMMGGGGAGQEKVSIISITNNATTITVNAKSVGGGAVEITDAVIKDSAGTTLFTVSVTATLPASGATTPVTITKALTTGNYYTVTLVSKLGNTFVSTAFKAS